MKFQLLCFVLFYLILSVFGKSSKFCSTDEDCNVEGTKCNKGLCVCDVGLVLSTNGEKCLEIALGIGSACTDTTQCTSLISGPAECNIQDLCSCAVGHVFFGNKCVKYRGYNETCTLDTPCFDGVDLFALKCEDKKCVCNDGYYARGEVGCRPSARADKTGECFFDIDCEDENMYCKYKLDTWGPLGKCMDVPNIPCEENEDCEVLENSFCAQDRNNTCFCNSGFDYDKKKNKCVEEKPDATKNIAKENDIDMNINLKTFSNIDCTTDEDCKDVRNSFCAAFRQKCTCKDSFIYDIYSEQCVRGLGAECLDTEYESIDPKCGVRYSTCNNNNLCQCPKYFIYSPYSDKCYKPTRKFGVHSCGSDENCYSFGLYATCTKTDSTDLINTCSCKPSSQYDKSLEYCVPSENGGEQNCKNNCKDKTHSTCENNECVCPENYLDFDLQCLPDIGSTCSLAGESDCVIENANCNLDSKICECDEGFFKIEARKCLKEIEDPEDECESDKQCVKLYDEGAICANKNCTCADTHILDQIDKKCVQKKHVGDICETKRQCKTMWNSENVVCRNGACSCDYDYKYSEEYSKCLYNTGSTLIQSQIILFFASIALLFK